MDIPSIDIYFNKRVADVERRLVESGMTELISSSIAAIAIYVYNRHLYRHPKAAPTETEPPPAEWANKWLESDLLEDTVRRD